MTIYLRVRAIEISAQIGVSLASAGISTYYPQHGEFDGDKTGSQVVDGELVPTGSYDAVTYEWYWYPPDTAIGRLIGLSKTDAPVEAQLEYRLAGPDVFWDGGDSASFWSGDANVFWGTPPDYTPYMSPFVAVDDLFQFRLTRDASAQAWTLSQLFNVVFSS